MDTIEFYILCLQNNEERFNNVMKVRESIPSINIVEAIDANTLSPSFIDTLKNGFLHRENGKFQDMYGRKYKLGSICATLSHLKALNLVKQQTKPYAMIFEDDIELSPTFHSDLIQVFERLNTMDVDMLNVHIMEPKKKEYSRFTNLDIHRICPGYWGCQAYIVRQSTVDKILNCLSEYKNPIDEQLSRSFSLKYYNVVGLDLLKRSNFLPSHIVGSNELDYE